MKCPCCDGEIEDAPKEALMAIPELSLLERSIVREILEGYPRGVTIGQLAAGIWPHGDGPQDEKNTIMVTIHRARKKLERWGWTIPRNQAGKVGRYQLERIQ